MEKFGNGRCFNIKVEKVQLNTSLSKPRHVYLDMILKGQESSWENVFLCDLKDLKNLRRLIDSGIKALTPPRIKSSPNKTKYEDLLDSSSEN